MVAKFTQEIFEAKVKEKTGNRLDISKFVYFGQASRGIVCCPKHGEYEVVASSLLSGKGCAKCYFESKVGVFKFDLSNFIEKARVVHGDKYSYGDAVYRGAKSKLIITCKIHGNFKQSASAHLKGQGCPSCGQITKGQKTRKSQSEFIEAVTKKHGGRYDLSTIIYRGYDHDITVVCKDHGEFVTSPASLLNSKIGCPQCALKVQGVKRQYPREKYIEQLIEIHGDKFQYGEILREKGGPYIETLCKQHGWFKASISNLRNGSGCKKCYFESRVGKYKSDTLAFIERAKAAHGDKYDYSMVEYSGTSGKVKIICPKHGTFEQAAGAHVAGQGCPECGSEIVGLRSRSNTGEVLSKIKAVHGEKYDYSNFKYEGCQKQTTVTCKKHGEFQILPLTLINGGGCKQCGIDASASKQKLKQADVISKIESKHGKKYGYENLNYTGSKNKIALSCEKHGQFNAEAGSIFKGTGCPRCANVGPSQGQLEMFEFINSVVPAELEVKFKNSQHSHDILIPSLDLSVEYHGLIWHSSKFQKNERADFKKHRLAAAEGIRVIHIYEDEWAFKRPVVERLLLSALGKLERTFARKTQVVTVERDTARKFFEDNHLQGPPRCSLFLGLEESGGLVACMAFGIARSIRYNNDHRLWELYRFAATKTVVGGASKLLKAFLDMKLCDAIVSYSDERLFTGRMYSTLGFTLDHVTPPDYCYTTGKPKDGRIHKSRLQRKYLATLLKNFDESLSEVENCRNNGLYQIYDCGKKRWTLKC